jgi:hypothetical protein
MISTYLFRFILIAFYMIMLKSLKSYKDWKEQLHLGAILGGGEGGTRTPKPFGT